MAQLKKHKQEKILVRRELDYLCLLADREVLIEDKKDTVSVDKKIETLGVEIRALEDSLGRLQGDGFKNSVRSSLLYRKYKCLRVYSNGESKMTYRTRHGVISWLAYNRRWRFGNSLFIDGHYIYGTGYICSGPRLKALEEQVKRFDKYPNLYEMPDRLGMYVRGDAIGPTFDILPHVSDEKDKPVVENALTVSDILSLDRAFTRTGVYSK